MKATRSAPTPRQAAGRLSEAGLRRARLVSGLVLMAFTALHLINHALLLVSLPVAEAARPVFLFVWRNPVGTLVLYGAVAVHLSLVLLALYRRRTLVMPPREALQVALGLLIPVLLAEHVVGTRVYESLTGIHVNYAFVLEALWVAAPATGVRQAIALVVIWAHGCLGIYFWVRFRAWYPRWAPWLLIAAVLVPVLALLGFAEGGRTVAAMPPFEPSPPVAREVIEAGLAAKQLLVRAIYLVFVALLALVLAARILRMRRERRNLLEIRYSAARWCASPGAIACWRQAASAASRIMPCAAAAAAARPAASRSPTGSTGSRRPARSSRRRSPASAPRPTSGSPASSTR